AELDRSFTGILLELSPGPELRKQNESSSTTRRLFELLYELRRPLLTLAWTGLVLDLLAVAVPVATQVVIDQVVGEGHVRWLGALGAGLAALVVLAIVFALLRDVLALRMQRYLDA